MFVKEPDPRDQQRGTIIFEDQDPKVLSVCRFQRTQSSFTFSVSAGGSVSIKLPKLTRDAVTRISGEVEVRPPLTLPPRADFGFTSLLVIIAQWYHPFPFRTRK